MKFPQLPLGQRFLFQGESYVKVGPLTARRERDGENRLIPRSAVVALSSAKGGGASTTPPDAPQRVARALQAYEETLRSALLSTGDPDGGCQGRLEAGLAAARRAFQDCLMEPDESPSVPPRAP